MNFHPIGSHKEVLCNCFGLTATQICWPRGMCSCLPELLYCLKIYRPSFICTRYAATTVQEMFKRLAFISLMDVSRFLFLLFYLLPFFFFELLFYLFDHLLKLYFPLWLCAVYTLLSGKNMTRFSHLN